MAPEAQGELPRVELEASPGWADYELVDSGNGSKLERYGSYSFIRPEPQAVWAPALSEKTWGAAHAWFQTSNEENGGHWQFRKEIPPRWRMTYRNLIFWAQTSSSRHLGIFPEQACQWDWTTAQIESLVRGGRQPRVLN